jgi:hypothetical protein
MTINGGCRCGAVRYTIEAEPPFSRLIQPGVFDSLEAPLMVGR